jgi:hypothetical protein
MEMPGSIWEVADETNVPTTGVSGFEGPVTGMSWIDVSEGPVFKKPVFEGSWIDVPEGPVLEGSGIDVSTEGVSPEGVSPEGAADESEDVGPTPHAVSPKNV